MAVHASMPMERNLLASAHTKNWLAFALIAALSAGCADRGSTQMATKPGVSETGVAPDRKIVLFRVVVNADGRPMENPWGLHFSGVRLFTIVAPQRTRLNPREVFLPGRLDARSSDAGWAFFTLPPGAYQLAFQGMAIRFAMASAQYIDSESVPIGTSPSYAFVASGDASLIYIGTFNFACETPAGQTDALKLNCRDLQILDEAQVARRVAESSLSQYGAVQEALASVP